MEKILFVNVYVKIVYVQVTENANLEASLNIF